MAKKITNVGKMPREEWLELRRNSIGGSDAAAACGASPWKSQLELYCEKMGMIADKETNESMRRGNYLEDYVALRFMEETGKKVQRDNFMYASDDFPCLTANIDRIVVGEHAGLECKTMNDYSSKDYDFEGGEIPTQYYYQLQHYMMVMGWEYMYIAFSTNFKFVWMKVDRNQDFINEMRQKELDFWYNNVVKHLPPDVDGSDSSLEALFTMYPNEIPDEIVEFNFEQLGARYIELNNTINLCKQEKDDIKAQICNILKEAEGGLSLNYKCSWKTQVKSGIDTKKLKADHPKLYEQYKTETTSRVFKLNKIKRKEV